MPHTNPYGAFKLVRESGLWLSDTTIANVSTARHGLAPKLSGNATDVFCGDGAYRAVSGVAGINYIRSTYAITANENDNFASGSLDTGGTRFSGAKAWSWTNQGSATATIARHQLQLVTGGTTGWHLIKMAVPASTPWLIRCHVGWPITFTSSTKAGGILLYDSVGGKLEHMGFGISPSGLVWASKWNSTSSFNSSRLTVGQTINYLIPCYFEIEDDGTNYYMRYGVNESNMVDAVVGGFARTNFLANVADYICLGVYSDIAAGTNATMYVEEFFRVI